MNRQIITFMIGESLLGVDIFIVKEIHRQLKLNHVPGSPPEIRGLVNLRGKIVTVLDLEVYLRQQSSDIIDDTRLLVLKTSADMVNLDIEQYDEDIDLGDDIVGLIIDSLEEVLTVDSKEILPTPPNLAEAESGLIGGVIKLDDRLALLLDVSAILEKARNQSETM